MITVSKWLKSSKIFRHCQQYEEQNPVSKRKTTTKEREKKTAKSACFLPRTCYHFEQRSTFPIVFILAFRTEALTYLKTTMNKVIELKQCKEVIVALVSIYHFVVKFWSLIFLCGLQISAVHCSARHHIIVRYSQRVRTDHWPSDQQTACISIRSPNNKFKFFEF